VVLTQGGGCLFIVGLYRKGEVWPHFPDIPSSVARHSQVVYVKIYGSPYIEYSLRFYDVGGKIWIDSFHVEDARCLSLIFMTLSHCTFDG